MQSRSGASGELDMGEEHFTVYQCDDCTLPWQFDGQQFDTALTFAVDSTGRLFDAETLEPLNLN